MVDGSYYKYQNILLLLSLRKFQMFYKELCTRRASLVTQLVNNPPAMWETWVQSLGWENPLEKEMATLSSILAWRILMERGAWQATVHGITKSWTQLRDYAHSKLYWKLGLKIKYILYHSYHRFPM